jgi:short-subunit dehydrogenase
VVANAALSPIGPFTTADPGALQQAIDLNCRAPVVLARQLLPPMADRKRGGLIVMSSLAGQQGSPGIAVYAGTKAFDGVFAESLWAEMRPHGVHVLACVAGAVETPGLVRNSKGRAPGTVTPDVVVSAALKALGRKPRVVPGAVSRLSTVLMSRLLPRRTAIGIIERASRGILPQ